MRLSHHARSRTYDAVRSTERGAIVKRMPRFSLFLLPAILMVTTAPARAADPLAGKWLLQHQEVGGNQTDSNPLTLAITPSGELLDFAFIVTVQNQSVVNLKFSTPLDGTESEVTGGDGKKMGTAKVSKEGAAYKFLMEGPGRPAVTTRMSVSSDGRTLVSESDVQTPSGDSLHTKQVFTRQ